MARLSGMGVRFKPDPSSVSPFATPRHVAGDARVSLKIFTCCGMAKRGT
jgi:hypothetical protein